MQQLGIVINLDHKVIICLVCNSAVVPKRLYKHFRTNPHRKNAAILSHGRLSFATKDFCSRLIRDHKVQDPCNCQPSSVVTVIFGLPVKDGYFCCTVCSYAVQTKEAMTIHLRKCKNSSFRKGPSQAWFPVAQRFYFAVKDHSSNPPNSSDPLALFTKQFSSAVPNPYGNIPVQSNSHPRDMNIFLTYENWLGEVEGMTGVQITEIAWNALPKLRPKIRTAVSLYVSQVTRELKKSTGAAERQSIGDYNK